jgi:hypothetical protein
MSADDSKEHFISIFKGEEQYQLGSMQLSALLSSFLLSHTDDGTVLPSESGCWISTGYTVFIPGDRSFHSHRCNNLKFYVVTASRYIQIDIRGRDMQRKS